MNAFFALINLSISILGIVLAARAIRSRRFALMPVYILLYIFTNCLGVSILSFSEVSHNIWPATYDRLVGAGDYRTLCICTWTFIGMALVFMNRLPKQAEKKPQSCLEIPSDVALALAIGLLGVGYVLYFKFMFLGPGLSTALETNFFQYDFSSAYAHRRELASVVEQGQGLLMATVASFVMLPLAAFFGILSKKGIGVVLVICAICFASSMLFCISLRQKAPVLLMVLLYGFLYLHFIRRSVIGFMIARFSDARAVGIGTVVFFAGLSLFYHITEGENLRESITHAFFRLLIIPVASNQAWIVAFPEILPFRGFVGVFDTLFWSAGMPVGSHDVSEVLTGYRFSLNASMVPVAWSAAGYLGVLSISALFWSIAIFVDRMLQRLNPELLVPMIILSLPSLLALTSTSFFDFVVKGGFIVQLTIIGAHLSFGKVRRPPASAPEVGKSGSRLSAMRQIVSSPPISGSQ